jgi:hypothetical protein
MGRMLARLILGAAIVAAMSGLALAQQNADDCNKMLDRISNEANYRFDEASHAAKLKMEQIAKLCKDGKTADAEKLAKETLASLNAR